MKSPFDSKEIPTDEEMADFLGGFSQKAEHPLTRRMRELNELVQGYENNSSKNP